MAVDQQKSALMLHLWSFLLIVGTILIIPIPFFEFVLPKLLFFALAAFTGAAAILLTSPPQSFAPLIGTWPGRFLLLFMLVVFFSVTWSVAPVMSVVGASPRFEGILSYGVFFALGLTAMVLAQQERGVHVLVFTILTSNVLVVLYGFLQLLNFDPLVIFWQSELFLGRLFSTLGQPNFLGQFILLTAPFVFLSAVRGQRWRRLFWTSVFFLNLFVLLGTASRGALLGLFVAGMFLLLVLGKGHKNLITQWRGNRFALGSILFVLIGAVMFMSFSPRFKVPTQERLSLGSRGVMWESSFAMMRARPQGYGLETIGIVSPRFVSEKLMEYESLVTQMDRAHSRPIDLLLMLGPAGFLAFYFFLVSLLLALWKRRKDPFILACFLGLIGESAAQLVGFDTAVTHVYFWMIAGMGVGLGIGGKKAVRTFPRLERMLLWILTLLIFLSIVLFSKWLHARVSLVASEKHFAQGEVALAVEEGLRSMNRFPFDRASSVRTVEKALLALEQTSDARSRGLLHEVIDFGLLRLWQVSGGRDGMVPLLRAWQGALKGEDDNVQVQVMKAIELAPRSVTTYRIAARAYEMLGNDAKRDAMLEELVKLLPEWWNDPQSEKGRILRKENPWITEIQN